MFWSHFLVLIPVRSHISRFLPWWRLANMSEQRLFGTNFKLLNSCVGSERIPAGSFSAVCCSCILNIWWILLGILFMESDGFQWRLVLLKLQPVYFWISAFPNKARSSDTRTGAGPDLTSDHSESEAEEATDGRRGGGVSVCCVVWDSGRIRQRKSWLYLWR